MWEPSQQGGFRGSLQVHMAPLPVFSASKTWGTNEVPLWAPLHQG